MARAAAIRGRVAGPRCCCSVDTSARSSGAEAQTTNNRMELTAVIRALEGAASGQYRAASTRIRSTCARGILEWVANWKKRGWKTADKKP